MEPKKSLPKIAVIYSCLLLSTLLQSCLLQPLGQVNSLAFSDDNDSDSVVQNSWANTGIAAQNAAVPIQKSVGIPSASAVVTYPDVVSQVQYPQPVAYPNTGIQPQYQQPLPYQNNGFQPQYQQPLPYQNTGIQAQYPQSVPYPSAGAHIPYPQAPHLQNAALYPHAAQLPVARGYAAGWTGGYDDDYNRNIDGQYWTGTAFPQQPLAVSHTPYAAGYQTGGISSYTSYGGSQNMFPGSYSHSQYGATYPQYQPYPMVATNPSYSSFNPNYWTGVQAHAPVYRHPVPVYHPAYHPYHHQMQRKKASNTKKLIGAAIVGALAGKVVSKIG